MKRIITGDWNGEEIWRYQTAEEQLIEELKKRNSKAFKDITVIEKVARLDFEDETGTT